MMRITLKITDSKRIPKKTGQSLQYGRGQQREGAPQKKSIQIITARSCRIKDKIIKDKVHF